MPTKKRKPLDTSSIESAWNKFFEDRKVIDADQLRKEGWMTTIDIAKKMKISTKSAAHLAISNVENGVLELMQCNIKSKNESTRFKNFYRPIK